MERYEHGGDIYGNPGVTLDFSVNTNPLGMPEEIRLALIARVDEFKLYPDPRCRELCDAISRNEDVPPEWVLCGNGAADLIYRLCYALKPNKALVCAPTFSEYECALEQVGCEVSHFILEAGNGFALTADIKKLLTPDVDILFLCNPNNPTGQLISKYVLTSVLHRAQENNTTVIIDECFFDFTDDGISCKEYLRDMPGLVVLKAFTKMYAMAGLRLGYLLSSDMELLSKVCAAAQCWSVSVPAQIAGTAALSCTDWQKKTRRLVTQERCFLTNALGETGIKVFASSANYLLLHSMSPLYEPLLRKGILIRRCGNFKGLDETYYRIGVKTHSENMRLIEAIREIQNG